ncbi:hypothetical protein KIN20_006898 [Parelaphostrongylus tenuis]|uniref:SCP domain-containing protein n=1 Tax=Parelaphostrongylus tenuis TaxID=148309 RepID=A0AAD5QHA5_PARTN|nr:hypothetical protein KIN20_006898 [Parelaphostrongylus tenuis]
MNGNKDVIFTKILFIEINCPKQNSDLFREITRATIYHKHNYLRTVLANGNQQNGRTTKTFPTATNMSLLKYDCELEEIAMNISKLCRKDFNHNFNFVGSNNATLDLPTTFKNWDLHHYVSDIVYDFIKEWWIASVSGAPLAADLTPTTADWNMIPFLQMANAATTRVGCGYTVCGSSDQRFLSFVCQYGEPHINVGVPIYKSGTPCSDCNKKCIFGLCDNEANQFSI